AFQAVPQDGEDQQRRLFLLQSEDQLLSDRAEPVDHSFGSALIALADLCITDRRQNDLAGGVLQGGERGVSLKVTLQILGGDPDLLGKGLALGEGHLERLQPLPGGGLPLGAAELVDLPLLGIDPELREDLLIFGGRRDLLRLHLLRLRGQLPDSLLLVYDVAGGPVGDLLVSRRGGVQGLRPGQEVLKVSPCPTHGTLGRALPLSLLGQISVDLLGSLHRGQVQVTHDLPHSGITLDQSGESRGIASRHQIPHFSIPLLSIGFRRAPGRTRTYNPRIKSPLLCPLSYRGSLGKLYPIIAHSLKDVNRQKEEHPNVVFPHWSALLEAHRARTRIPSRCQTARRPCGVMSLLMGPEGLEPSLYGF